MRAVDFIMPDACYILSWWMRAVDFVMLDTGYRFCNGRCALYMLSCWMPARFCFAMLDVCCRFCLADARSRCCHSGYARCGFCRAGWMPAAVQCANAVTVFCEIGKRSNCIFAQIDFLAYLWCIVKKHIKFYPDTSHSWKIVWKMQ